MKFNGLVNKAIRYLCNANYRFLYNAALGLYNDMPDKEFLEKKFRAVMGYDLCIESPKTFNEKLQWLKLYNRHPEYTMMVDKYLVRKYIADTIGEEYLIPLIGVWDKFDDIDFASLPNQFVLKCTHDSGGLVICRNKDTLDYKKAKEKINKSLKRNYYLTGREWPYKDVKPRIIAEKYMEDNPDSKELTDYKLMCFNGKVRCSFTCSSRYAKEGLKVTFYDTDWQKMPFERHYPAEAVAQEKPKSYDEMVTLAEKLADKIPFVRIDFYEIKGRPYFGEVTFFPGNGLEEFTPEKWDETLGSWIELPNKEGKLLFTERGGVIYLPYQKKRDLTDYKFFCFNGKPVYCQVIMDRTTDEAINFYDMNWQLQEFTGLTTHKKFDKKVAKPINFEKMKCFAKVLAQDIHFVRVDFYEINGKLYFGELTFFPAGGFGYFVPYIWNKIIGDLLVLPDKENIEC